MTLEELLNKLIEKGWKPRNREKTLHICCYDKCKGMDYQWIHLDGGFMNEESKVLRELVSKESNLWQFVCENGMVEDKGEIRYKADENNDIDDANYMSEFYYWLIEASLKDESELEQFLLSNIVIKDEE